MSRQEPVIGVVIVSYNASGFIADCLESLLATRHPGLRIVVVDNASDDATLDTLRAWASCAMAPEPGEDWPFPPEHRAPRPIALGEFDPDGPPSAPLPLISLIRSSRNLGFAGGVNIGLRALLADPAIDLFWILNPDTLVSPGAPRAFAAKAVEMGRFAVIGGRIVFLSKPEVIQIDGGRLSRFARSVEAVNFGCKAADAPVPDPESLDFISGACMVASREFVERAGMIDESYFLYFEEIDWQLRRGDLPLGIASGAIVLHRAGATIGSGGLTRPSPLSVYFTYRNLLRFVARWYPAHLPFAYAFAWARMLRNFDGTWNQALAFLKGIHQLSPPKAVRRILNEETWTRIGGGPE